jgi:uncharacterized protein YegL
VIWLLDCSGSMAISGKIEALNNAIREVVPAMRKAAEGNPEVQFYVRAIRFATGATWHVAEPTLLPDFKWVDLHAEGETDMGQAFALLAQEMNNIPTEARMLPPQIVLISDGKPTDDWKGALQALARRPTRKRCASLSTTLKSRCSGWIMRSSWYVISAMSPRRSRRRPRGKSRRRFRWSLRRRPTTMRCGKE